MTVATTSRAEKARASTARGRHMGEFMKNAYPAYSRRVTQVCVLSQALERIAAGEADVASIAKEALGPANPFDWKGRSSKKIPSAAPADAHSVS